MSNIPVTWANETARKRDLRQQKIANFKSAARRWWHGFYWRILHVTKLARPCSVTMCALGLYRKFPDGRCMWCGDKHGRSSKGEKNAAAKLKERQVRVIKRLLRERSMRSLARRYGVSLATIQCIRNGITWRHV